MATGEEISKAITVLTDRIVTHQQQIALYLNPYFFVKVDWPKVALFPNHKVQFTFELHIDGVDPDFAKHILSFFMGSGGSISPYQLFSSRQQGSYDFDDLSLLPAILFKDLGWHSRMAIDWGDDAYHNFKTWCDSVEKKIPGDPDSIPGTIAFGKILIAFQPYSEDGPLVRYYLLGYPDGGDARTEDGTPFGEIAAFRSEVLSAIARFRETDKFTETMESFVMRLFTDFNFPETAGIPNLAKEALRAETVPEAWPIRRREPAKPQEPLPEVIEIRTPEQRISAVESEITEIKNSMAEGFVNLKREILEKIQDFAKKPT